MILNSSAPNISKLASPWKSSVGAQDLKKIAILSMFYDIINMTSLSHIE